MADFTTWCPSVPATMQVKRRMNVAQFGDGYQQRELDGINSIDRQWSVEYATRIANDIVAMDTYLVSMKGREFPFKDPATGAIWNVFCDEWDIEWELVRFLPNGSKEVYGTLSADFLKANGIGA